MKRLRLRIGIVGCGAIGSSLAECIVRDFAKAAVLSALCDAEEKKAQVLSRRLGKGTLVTDIAGLITKSDLIIEAASARCSAQVAMAAIQKKKDVMVMSVGGLVGAIDKIKRRAQRSGSKVYIPSGAISGIDAVKAAGMGRIKSATLTTTKNPASFKGVKYVEAKLKGLDKIKKPVILFSGPAREAVKYFPQNINVAAVLSLAGIGADRTGVRIVASPRVSKNIHEIDIVAEAGNISTRTENILHPENPKTSYLAVLSAQAVLKQVLEPVKIGT
jgi:aspartate dehydrogenase